MPFEILNRAFVFFRRSLAVERAEIFSFARSRIYLAGIQPILAGFQFSNHNDSHRSFCSLFRDVALNKSASSAARIARFVVRWLGKLQCWLA